MGVADGLGDGVEGHDLGVGERGVAQPAGVGVAPVLERGPVVPVHHDTRLRPRRHQRNVERLRLVLQANMLNSTGRGQVRISADKKIFISRAEHILPGKARAM